MTDPYLIPPKSVVSFSGGRTSGYMLRMILDAFGGELPPDRHVVFANTGREMPETLDFVQECSERWNVKIVWLEYDPTAEHKTAIVSHNSASRNGEPLAAVFRARRMPPNPVMRFCTIDTKIKRIQSYAKHWLNYDTWTSVVGLRADEMSRVTKQINRSGSEKYGKRNGIPFMPLANAGVTKRDVQAWWNTQTFDLRLPNINGSTPAGNCDLCFLKGEATIKGILRNQPDLADWWIDQERQFPSTKRPGEFCTFRSDRPSYAALLDASERQGDLMDFMPDGESVDCACTD